MRIITYGEWKGSLCVDGDLKENPNSDHNFTYNTAEEKDEVEIVLRLRPGKTDLKIEITGN